MDTVTDMVANTGASALEQLMGHAAWLRRFARALLRDGDDADDLVQSTLVAAWQHPAPDPSRPRSWLARIAQNRAKDFRKAEARRDVRELAAAGPAASEPAPGPEQLLGDLQIHRTVAEVVTALAEPYRQTLLLRYYEGLSAAEIATRLGTPAGTIRWRLKEGLDRVRRALDQRCDGDRSRWTLALAPLLPPVLATSVAGAGVAGAAAAAVGGIRLGAPAVVVGALVVASAGLITVALWPRAEAPVDSGTPGAAAEPRPAPQSAPAVRSAGERAAVPGGGPRLAFAPGARVGGASGPGGEISAEADRIAQHMIGAIAGGSYDEFLTYADDQFKASLDKNTIAEVSRQMASKLERGFELAPLGSLRKEEGHTTYLWKLDLGEAEDEHLIRLVLKDGKVAGFWIQ
jgi:RNA polymerase sigma-70 factor (ECF subfamily)